MNEDAQDGSGKNGSPALKIERANHCTGEGSIE